MREKSPRSGNDKKQGKSLKEKRSVKNAKKAERARSATRNRYTRPGVGHPHGELPQYGQPFT